MKVILTLFTLALASLSSGCQEDTDSFGASAESDAQYICDALTHCFELQLGTQCAGDIEATTAARDIAQCANCYGTSSCADIGAPGVPGICDVQCHNALFGVRQ